MYSILFLTCTVIVSFFNTKVYGIEKKIAPSMNNKEKGNKAQEKKSAKDKMKGILKGKDNLCRKNATVYRFEFHPISRV